MSFTFTLKRNLQQWRSWSTLLFVSVFTTAFFAFGPLYLDYNNEVLLRYTLENASEGERHLVLSVFDAPFNTWDEQTLETLDYLSSNSWKYKRSVYDAERESYQIYAFGAFFDQIATIHTGHFPRSTIDWENKVPILEAVVTTTVAEKERLEVGAVFSLPALQAKFRIVGIVKVNDPEGYFWKGNRLFTHGADVALESGRRYDWGFAVNNETYNTLLEGVVRSTNYLQFIAFGTDRITAFNYEQVKNTLNQAQRRINANHGGSVFVFGGLLPVLERHQQQLRQSASSITVLSALVLLLMLYNLMSIANLVSQTQLSEWGMLYLRGGSPRQLLQMRLLPIVIVGVASSFIGIWVSRGILFAMSSVTGQENLQIAQQVPAPRLSLILSGVAGTACVMVLLEPVLQFPDWNLFFHQRARARPISKPTWVQYQIDKVILLAAVVFSLRLYWITSANPSRFFHDAVASPYDVMELIANNFPAGIVRDPFVIAIPGLFLTGCALLWLRSFPHLIHVVAVVSSYLRSLTVPLAVWHVERNTKQYGQFSLVVITTLSIGVASVTLQTAQKALAWTHALSNTGGDIRLELAVGPRGSEERTWTHSDEVIRYAEAIRLQAKPKNELSSQPLTLAGVIPSEFAQMFPEVSGVDHFVVSSSLMEMESASGIDLIPVLVSKGFAETFKGNFGISINHSTPSLAVGDQRNIKISLQTSDTFTIGLRVIGIIDSFPGLNDQNDLLVIMPQFIMQMVFDQAYGPAWLPMTKKIVWVDLASSKPSDSLRRTINIIPSLEVVSYAWDQYNTIVRKPVTNTVTGLLLVGFWISLILNLINFVCYIVITTYQRLPSLSVLRALGWTTRKVYRLLLLEQTIIVLPSSLVGIILGLLLTYILFPFLGYSQSIIFQVPMLRIAKLALILSSGYIVIIIVLGFWLNRTVFYHTLRVMGE